MRNDYQPYFRQLKARVDELGYSNVKEDELDAEFFLLCGWSLRFECERYYGPAFDISIVPPAPTTRNPDGYAVRILMRVLEKLDNKLYGKPTIDGQMDFLVQQADRIFADPAFYDAEYTKLNEDI